ncbi:MAG TPA: hypothetical protein VFN74_21345 [Chloroflexota bacterium]|nr:hypothetical protein [Chloroflexota bacterium]
MVAPADVTTRRALRLPAEENEVSRRYLRLMEAWIPVGVEYFAAWPERPGCGHFFGGCHWYGLESIGPALTFALAASSPEYDERATGVARAELRRMARDAVRYLCFTHDAGPPECVRPAVGLGRKENWGTKWGQRGEGFFRESQCGPTVAAIGLLCLLLHQADPALIDEETWLLASAVSEDYGDRFGEMPPRSGVYYDTQMEENYWTAHGLNGVSLFLAEHEKSAAWQAMARRWMFSACAAPQDAKNLGAIAAGGATTVRALTGRTFTTLPDYWAENHGMVHPNYTASGVRTLLTDGAFYLLYGHAREALPPEMFWNRRRLYENLKALTDTGGYVQAVQGMDWHYLPAAGDEAAHACAALWFGDPDAAAFQRLALRRAELRQRGNGGRLYDRNLTARAHDVQDPMIMREVYISRAAEVYLLYRLMGAGPEPTPEDELDRRLEGVRHFPHAGFVHHRHPRGQTSLSWRNSIMALPLTREGIFTIAPASDSFLGRPRVAGHPDSHHVRSVKVREHDRGFAACLVIDRCQETLRQEVVFASLPDGRVLACERFTALADVVVEALDQGVLRITNETFPLLAPNCRGERVLAFPGGAKSYLGWLGESEADDVIDSYDRPAWLNVDGRLGLVFAGDGQTVYHNRRHHRPYHAIADDLILSRLTAPKQVRSGESVAQLAVLLSPEQAPEQTAASQLSLSTTREAVCLATDGYFVAANLAPETRVCSFDLGPARESVPAVLGATVESRDGRLHLTVLLEAHGAATLRVSKQVPHAAGLRVSTMPDGAVFSTRA